MLAKATATSDPAMCLEVVFSSKLECVFLKQIIENYHEIVILAFQHVSSLGPHDLRPT